MEQPIIHNNTPLAIPFSLDFPRYLSTPDHAMGFRTEMADFQVFENLDISPCGEGEHLYLKIRKTNENTRWIAHKLAIFYNLPDMAVGYCGLKDRRAVTTQWFSVHLPACPEAPEADIPGCEVLEAGRHTRKLKPGMHTDNSFVIVLRGTSDMEEDLDARLKVIERHGVPNYFGEQRFGKNANNLSEVAKIVSSPHPRFKGKKGGLYLSAARSWLFNQVLAKHVQTDKWQTLQDGPLWGRGRLQLDRALAEEEMGMLSPWQDWCLALEHSGLRQERRDLRLRPRDFSWRWGTGKLTLSFTLPPGTYATAVLRELAELVVPPTGD